ncbi:MAG: AAC(3) family N-acetyltransferase [Crocinitomicaceae bacterium]
MIITIPNTSSVLDFFKSLNLKSNDIVVLSSDVGRLAMLCKSKGETLDVNSIIDCLQEILSEGTILIPAFTDNLVDGDTFDWRKSKPTTGAVSNKVQRRKDFIRSSDPLHSYFVWGKDMDNVLARNDDSTFGKNSVFAFLKEKNAKFVLLDVSLQDSLTFIHYIEEQNKVKYRKSYFYSIDCIYPEGNRTRKIEFNSRKLGVRTYVTDLFEQFVAKDLNQSYVYLNSRIDIICAEDVWEVGLECINKGPKLHKYTVMNHIKDFVKRHILKRKGVF